MNLCTRMAIMASVVTSTVLAVTPGHAANSIQITAKKQTASSRKSARQDLPRGDTRLTEEYVFYRFDLRSVMPLSGPVVAKWALAVERADGRLQLAESGSETLELKMGQTVSIETGEVKLREREMRGWRGGGGDWSDRIAGYGVRLFDQAGNMLAEKFSSNSMKKEYEQAIERKAGREQERLGVPDRRLKKKALRRGDPLAP